LLALPTDHLLLVKGIQNDVGRVTSLLAIAP